MVAYMPAAPEFIFCVNQAKQKTGRVLKMHPAL